MRAPTLVAGTAAATPHPATPRTGIHRLLPRRIRQRHRLLFFGTADALLLSCGLLAAFALRFDRLPNPAELPGLLLLDAALLVATIGALAIYGVYRVSWSYFTLLDMLKVGLAAAFGAAILATLLSVAGDRWPLAGLPGALVWIQAPLAFVSLSFFRISKRVLAMARRGFRRSGSAKPTLVVGAGRNGLELLRSIHDTPLRDAYRVVGFLDDDAQAKNTFLRDVPVLGPIAELEAEVRRYAVEIVVITLEHAEGSVVRDIVQRCRASGVHQVRILPPVSHLVEGRVTLQATREVSLEDLLGRDVVEIDHAQVAELLRGQRIAVTGGAGTIGSELCSQVARFQPERLLVLDIDESRLHDVCLGLRETTPGLDVEPLLVDVRRPAELEAAFRRHRPAVVFHAAALKHVPLMEAWPVAALETNVLGTLNVLDAARKHGARKFVLISTDKAVEPCNVMGASKRLAELATLRAHGRQPERAIVRFGNVIGSRGSVIPIFEAQLARGGPLTVTHPDVERYFMMTSEAVSLVLQAAALEANDDVFLLDMGSPVRILDLAHEFLRLRGQRPDVDVPIVFTGLRPGERLTEHLHYDHEKPAPTLHPKVLRVSAGPADTHVELDQIRKIVEQGDPDVAREFLAALFPGLDGTRRPGVAAPVSPHVVERIPP